MKLRIACLLGCHAAATKFSNLPADICSTPGTKDLDVAAGSSTMLGAEVPCDALVPQGDGLPDVCVYKFAKATVAGLLTLRAEPAPGPFEPGPSSPPVAIVTTTSFSLEGSGQIDVQGDAMREASGADGRGAGGVWGGGAGHVTPGGASGTGGQAGSAYGPTTGAQLVGGSGGMRGLNGLWPGGGGGRGGGALQVASCGTLKLEGSIQASGADGEFGQPSGGAAVSAGGGAGSGGTIVVEAAEVTGSGGRLSAIGGSGGSGGCVFTSSVNCEGAGAGGQGGTGSSAPQDGAPGTMASSGHFGAAGGGGGAIGRIVINVASSCGGVPAIASDPPATMGTLPK